ncbi:MAG: hypothetical protein WC360_04385 [Opitutales bacterium]
MRIPSLLLTLTCVAAICLCAQAGATLLDSWENDGFAGIGDATGPWMRHDKAPAGMTFVFSNKHASEGEYSLAVTTPGGWTRAMINTGNRTLALGDASLRRVMSDKLMISIDVYADESLISGTIDMVMIGNGMDWTQCGGDPLRCGGSITLRYLITPETAARLALDNEWFQFIIIIDSKGPGTLYLDNLRAE